MSENFDIIIVTQLLLLNFLPSTPSPKSISYFSSWTSCSKYVSENVVIPTILSICEKSVFEVEDIVSFTLTLG